MRITLKQLGENSYDVKQAQRELKQFKCWTSEYSKAGEKLNRLISKQKRMKALYFGGCN